MSKILFAFTQNKTTIRRIVKKYAPTLESEDLMQEVFLRCFAAERKNLILNPKAFVLKVAKNSAISANKSLGMRMESSIDEALGGETMIDPSARVDSIVGEREKLNLLVSALLEMPEEHREALLLKKVEGLKFKQIATRLDVSVSTVEKRVSFALLYCMQKMKKMGLDTSELNQHGRSSTWSKVGAYSASGAGTKQH